MRIDPPVLFPCRNGWIPWHCWLQADENEKSGRHKNVSSPDPHACGCPRLCGRSHDYWYVARSVTFLNKTSFLFQFVAQFEDCHVTYLSFFVFRRPVFNVQRIHCKTHTRTESGGTQVKSYTDIHVP